MKLRMFLSMSVVGSLSLATAGCSVSHDAEPTTGGEEDAFTSVPDCKGFDLAAMIDRTHDLPRRL